MIFLLSNLTSDEKIEEVIKLMRKYMAEEQYAMASNIISEGENFLKIQEYYIKNHTEDTGI